MDNMIDLGREAGCCGPAVVEKSDSKKKYYPNVYISDVDGLDLEVGEIMFVAKGVVKSTSERKTDKGKTSYTCDIEIHAIKPVLDSEDGLDSALAKIAKKKMKVEDED
jgi:hypothetical protein